MSTLAEALQTPAVSTALLVAASLFLVACLLHLAAIRREPTATPVDPEDTDVVRVPAQRSATSTDRHAPAPGELAYLERMLTGESTEPEAFPVAEVVASSVAARRATGLLVDVISRDAHVDGVPQDLAVVLDNLLVNAERHGGGCGVQVESTTTDGFVEVVVSDRGPGVPDDVRPQLFEPGASAGDRSGAGLGLHISRNLLREQGGDLLLRETERGATFVARLPVPTRRAGTLQVPGQRVAHRG